MPAPAAAQPVTLAPVFSSHMVIQRDAPVPVWGKARPGERLRVRLGSASAAATADAAGNWRVVLPGRKPGPPVTLAVAGAEGTVRLADVAVGDVYLCAGQSNMEYPVQNSTGGGDAIAAAADPLLRLLHIPRPAESDLAPPALVSASWQGASAQTIADFPAACYFMGRALRARTGLPIGLIGAAVGGSAIQTWLSGEAFVRTGGDPQRLELAGLRARDPLAAAERWGVLWEAWWRGATADGLGFPWRDGYRPDGRWLAEPRGTMWDQWDAPELAGGKGMMVYRTAFRLTEAQAARAGVLELGAIRELDQAWINGHPVGATYGPDTARAYRVPAGVLRAGENIVTLAVDSRWLTGGFLQPASRRLVLDGAGALDLADWRYRVVPGWIGYMPRPPWNPLTGPSVLYSAMIAPLGEVPLRAVAWYQGEQNGDDAGDYQRLLTALMADWRARFGAATGFIVVQLPNLGTRQSASLNTNLPWLREAQRQAVGGDPRARLVVTIDVGDPNDIHPRDKLTVGLRMADAALSLTSGLTLPPTIGTARPDRDGSVLVALRGGHSFGTRAGAAPKSFSACSSGSGVCRPVAATLDDNTLRVQGLSSEDDVLTYCWAENPSCNIYDERGAPLEPFQLRLNK